MSHYFILIIVSSLVNANNVIKNLRQSKIWMTKPLTRNSLCHVLFLLHNFFKYKVKNTVMILIYAQIFYSITIIKWLHSIKWIQKKNDNNLIKTKCIKCDFFYWWSFSLRVDKKSKTEIKNILSFFFINSLRIYTWSCWKPCKRRCCKWWWSCIIKYSCICCFKRINIILHRSIIIIWLFKFIT